MVYSTYDNLSSDVKSAIHSYEKAIGSNSLSFLSDNVTGEMRLAISLYYYIQTQKQSEPSAEFDRVMQILHKYLRILPEVISVDEIDVLVHSYPQVVEYALDFLGKDSIFSRTAIWCQDKCLTDFVVELFKSYMGKEEGLEIYNPFMGIGSYAVSLPKCHFIGEEISEECWAFSQINLHAHNCDAGVRCGDSFLHLKDMGHHYDAVIMTPPFGIKGKFTEFDALDLAFQKVKENGFVFCILPQYFCSSSRNTEIRRKFLDRGALLHVISLPDILFGPLTNVSTCMVVLKKSAKGRFLVTNGKSFVSIDDDIYSTPLFSYQGLLEKIQQIDKRFNKFVSYESLNDPFDISPAKLMLQLEDSKYPTRSLGELINVIPLKHIRNAKGFCVGQNELSNNFCDCNIRKNELSEHTKASAQLIYNKCIILSRHFTKSWYYAKVTTEDIADYNPLYAMPSCIAFSVNCEVINEDYLLYILQTDFVKRQAEAYRGGNIVGLVSIVDLMAIRIPLPSLEEQLDIIELQRKLYVLKIEQNRKAENSRRGYKQTLSDMIHMLGTPLNNIRNIIAILEDEVTDEGISDFKVLHDNFDYLSRLIKLGNTDFASMPKSQLNIKDFLCKYLEAYKNFGAKSFDISYQDHLKGTELLEANPDALSVMMDCILDNAHRHGFDKKYSEGNIVVISAEIVDTENDKVLLLCIRNNGLPIPEGFTLEDYSSRGKFTMKSGHSGLGGAHVSEIVHATGGMLDFSVDNPDSKNLLNIDQREVWTRFFIQFPIH